VVAQVHLECNKEACLSVQLDPEPGADLQAKEAMAFLFGCDDDDGNIDCASASRSRMFFRYAPGAP
jgi:hypothetical protein